MESRYWVVMPAAGAGRRMGGEIAKQYLALLERTVIEWSLAPLLADSRLQTIMVVLASDDVTWRTLPVAQHPKIRTTLGGGERADSVRAGLRALADMAQAQDWVLVHDAARPCLDAADLDNLIAALGTTDEPAGGLLATPLADTLKLADAQLRVINTLPRAGLWRALTPQMFRYDVLRRAYRHAAEQDVSVTDEAAAVEALGFAPRLIAGRADNLKITIPGDLALAASILAARPQGS